MSGPRWSIRTKFVLLTAGVASLALVASLAFLIHGQERLLRTELRNSLDAAGESVAQNLTSSLLFDDTEIAATTLASFAVQDEVRSAVLLDDSGQVFAAFRAESATDEEQKADASASLALEFPVAHDGERYGTLIVHASLDSLRAAQAELLRSGLITLSVAVIAVWLLAGWMLRVMTRPISDLASAAQRFGQQDFSGPPVAQRSHDEVGDLVVAFNDMAEAIRQRDARLSQHARELEERVAERTEQLRAERDRAELASRAKSEFVANMSHEIRTPMHAVLGMADLVADGHLEPEQRESMRTLQNSAQGLLGLLENVLDFSRLEAGKLELSPRPFVLDELAAGVMRTLGLRAERKGVEMLLNVHPDVPTRLLGDDLRLRQVLINLVGNAVKFTESGEIELGIEPLRADGDRMVVQFAVRDTGVGISPAAQRVIFDSFSQADNSVTREFGGSGLGLTICSRLVGLMGGGITVTSEPGAGTTFVFTADLGRLADRVPNDSTAAAHRDERFAGPALCVVPHPERRRGILSALQAVGFDPVRACGTVESACRAAGEGPAPRCLVVDVASVDVAALRELMTHYASMDVATIALTDQVGSSNHAGAEFEGAFRGQVSRPLVASDLRRLLAVEAEASSPPADQSAERSERACHRILLAEDHPVNQRLARAILSKAGHTVDVAGDGAACLEILAEGEYDLVLMDLHMPILDGVAAMREIRRREAGSSERVPVVALTASATTEDRERSRQAGADGYLVKPIRRDDLLAAVDRFAAARTAQPTRDA